MSEYRKYTPEGFTPRVESHRMDLNKLGELVNLTERQETRLHAFQLENILARNVIDRIDRIK